MTAIKEIGESITRISEIASSITTAVEAQDSTIQEIARSVAQAAQGAVQVAANIAHVNHGADETAASAKVLLAAQSLSGESRKLEAEVKNFLATVRAT